MLLYYYFLSPFQETPVTGRKADVIKAAHLCAEAALRLVKPGNQVMIGSYFSHGPWQFEESGQDFPAPVQAWNNSEYTNKKLDFFWEEVMWEL